MHIDLNRPMAEIRAELSKYPVKTRVMLTGPMVVARDIAHAKMKERLDAGRGHAAVPAGLLRLLRRPGEDARRAWPAARSARPRRAGWTATSTSSRPPAGAWSCSPRATAAAQVTDACKAHGGFYLGSIGGPAARLAQDCITKVEVLEYPELGMEAVWKIEVQDFPAFIVVDDKGNDFFDLVEQALRRGDHPGHHLLTDAAAHPDGWMCVNGA